MTTIRKKRKFAAVSKGTKELTRNIQPQDTSVPGINGKYNTPVTEEIEGKVTKKLSQEFTKTETRILVALSKSDEFLLNPQVRTHAGTVPVTS